MTTCLYTVLVQHCAVCVMVKVITSYLTNEARPVIHLIYCKMFIAALHECVRWKRRRCLLKRHLPENNMTLHKTLKIAEKTGMQLCKYGSNMVSRTFQANLRFYSTHFFASLHSQTNQSYSIFRSTHWRANTYSTWLVLWGILQALVVF